MKTRYLLIHMEFLHRRVEEWRAMYREILDTPGVKIQPGRGREYDDIMSSYKELSRLSQDYIEVPAVRTRLQELTAAVSAYEFERSIMQECNDL